MGVLQQKILHLAVDLQNHRGIFVFLGQGLIDADPVGVAVAGTGRFLSHFISGMVYFADYAPTGMSPIVYSAVYNGTYIIPSVIICAVIVVLLQRSKALKTFL